jgi:hypothetical protein
MFGLDHFPKLFGFPTIGRLKRAPIPHLTVVERRLDYVSWARQVVAGLRGVSRWLEQQFDEAVELAKESVYHQ